MKKFRIIIMTGLVCILCKVNLFAQQSPAIIESKSIEPLKLSVSFNKTSNIIFPYPIKSVDRGSSVILVQKAKAVENILQVKAAQLGFASTNLSVITSDGKFYSFIVDYAIEPMPLNISLNNDSVNAFLSDIPINEAVLKTEAEQVQLQAFFLHKKVNEQKMKLSMKGIYLSANVMWFKFHLNNRSLITYSPDNIRFYIRDRKRSNRTAVQENKLQPVYLPPPFVVNGEQANDFIYGFNPFTIPSNRELVMQISEKAGGRLLNMRVNHKIILKARLVNN